MTTAHAIRLLTARARAGLPIALALLLLTALAGCQSDGSMASGRAADHGLVGTWRGQERNEATPFQFASVTFAPDGTYTAQMHYNDKTVADSGKWNADGDMLTVEQGRRYRYRISGDTVTFTDPESNVSQALARLR